FTASAMWPKPTMWPLFNSATPSACDRRSPRSTLSAMGPSAGSLISARSSGTAARGDTVLLLKAFYRERHVVAAEPEAVAQDGAHFALLGGVGRVVEIELGIRRLVVDRRRYDAVARGERADDELHGARGAQHVAGHRLGRTDRHALRVLAEDGLDRLRLVRVVGGRRRAVGVDVVDVGGRPAGILHGDAH